MKKIVCIVTCLALCHCVTISYAQLNKLKNKAKEKIDKPDNKTTQPQNERETTVATDNTIGTPNTATNSGMGNQSLEIYSKYDFVPGDKVMAFEDFNQTEIGDFPARWNTNATAEVVTTSARPGKWMKINKEGVFHPEFITSIPDNFTLEFDLGVNPDWNSMPLVINITNLKTPAEYTDYYHFVTWKGTHTIHMEFQPAKVDLRSGNSNLIAGRDGNHLVNNDVEYKSWDNATKNFAHIALWRQNKRLRVYLNGEKIWDVQNVFDPQSKYNAITFAMQGSYKLDDYFLFSNLRLAGGAPDTRNKLFKDKKFVTRGIHFNPNSDEIKPESFGTLREIGNILKDSLVGIKIIGHTDGDGDDKLNLDLSKRRAAAVKDYLVKNYGLASDNIEIDGKGENIPVDKNTTQEGKANNRRVEFVTLPITVKPTPKN